VLVAQDGKVLVDKSYNVPDDSAGQGTNRYATYMPTTTVPQFDLGNLALPFYSVLIQNMVAEGKLRLADTIPDTRGLTLATFLSGSAGQVPAEFVGKMIAEKTGRPMANAVTTRLYGPIGMHQTAMIAGGEFRSNVDELYRFELGLEDSGMFLSDSATARGAKSIDPSLGWTSDKYRGATRIWQSRVAGGKGSVFMRLPDQKLTLIILTDDKAVDALKVAERIAERFR
jgi:CubicO group peptidase (beta-lactamase class C family)